MINKYIKEDPWRILETEFSNTVNEVSESLFSIGNGHMGQRANFEEDFSGASLQGSYIGGVYYPDKTKVGWWKNGYPEYFAKVLNSVNWIGLSIKINGEILDLNTVTKIVSFKRELDMMTGILSREFRVVMSSGAEIQVNCSRFVSMDEGEIGAMDYKIKCLNKSVFLEVESYLDNDVKNKDSNYNEKFWIEDNVFANDEYIFVSAKTKKTNFIVSTLAHTELKHGSKELVEAQSFSTSVNYASQKYQYQIPKGEQITINKIVAISSSLNHSAENLKANCYQKLDLAVFYGYDQLAENHAKYWADIWSHCDIIIEGDIAAQQGIRFNIFQLYQTYTGEDSRLNIGPKGFTGEKYGGSTYWDTEAYCLPFYLATGDESIAKNLLVYRYNHLGKAIENAEKLGFKNGAALYPMVTMNGEECHNEWEITFEEIHRNGAIAYAIYDYVNYTQDKDYIKEYGFEVLVGIARFWSQRFNFSKQKNQYVMLGVTGPNEYENNVNNNWYTNYIAKWCLEYTTQCSEAIKVDRPELFEKLKLTDDEINNWIEITKNVYFPEDAERNIFLQQDGFLDKEIISVADLNDANRPIHKKWSWDRILRSCFIKQADVLQGIYFFEENFSSETIKRNFEFYEPLTVHESSLSPCVHSILAAKIGLEQKSYELYLQTSRLDLDDYNSDTCDGLHITSMAGTWLSIVKGFGGMRITNGDLHFDTFLPKQWQRLSFKVKYRGAVLLVKISENNSTITNEGPEEVTVFLNGQTMTLKGIYEEV